METILSPYHELLRLFGLFGTNEEKADKRTRPELRKPVQSRTKAQYVASDLKREKAIASRNKRKAAKRSNKGNQHRS